MNELTPMMKQYYEIKQEYKDAILMFRMGDFYEMFMEDAEIASRELEIVLTAREAGKGRKVPMAGVPYHAVDSYIAKLIENGHKIAICEQVEDPKTSKGLVKREVVRVITPGTAIEQSILDEKKNNYLIAIYQEDREYGLAVVDNSTGEFYIHQFSNEKGEIELINEISIWQPVECLWNQDFNRNKLSKSIKNILNPLITVVDNQWIEYEESSKFVEEKIIAEELQIIKEKNYNLAYKAACILVTYLIKTQKSKPEHINNISLFKTNQYMTLDQSTCRNLELTRTIMTNKKQGSLLDILDQTVTAMGSRLLANWIERPLINLTLIQERLDSVEGLFTNTIERKKLQRSLKQIYDLERIISRIVLERANAKDFIALKNSLLCIPDIKETLSKLTPQLLKDINAKIDPLTDLVKLIEQSIVDDPPFNLKEGGIIKPGYSKELDKLREASHSGKRWLAELEAKEKNETGIKSLKVAYNKVFGYYIEVTKPNLHLVPARYERKQTLVNSERFITQELKEIENLILSAESRMNEIEYELFQEIRASISCQAARIQQTAKAIAVLDVLVSLAEVASINRYTKPIIDLSDEIIIKDGRHPVVEKTNITDGFIANDCYLNCSDNQILIITGPNMAGKSTFMRQVALIVLMAQIGSFVPASEAKIGIVDRIFTRVGASDDLSTGQSTFMIEMNEVASILTNATPKSLLILDEIGRGTSTFDGISIAWAVTEYIHNHPNLGCRTLFATHYHELTELANLLPRVKNYSISVLEKGE
ncbi:MAG TPA: DNA mismatch repair protein MutS, partial [Clostridia bacterium]|nr:DNA mismatch repair protein MutS [Clostridia bacterium]